MMFTVRCAAPGDTAVSERFIEAATEDAVRDRLVEQGVVVLSVRRQRNAQAKSRHASRSDFPTFCRELRTLVKAGMTVVEAVDTLCARDMARDATHALAAPLLEQLQRGLSLSAALGQLPNTPPVLVASVKAGERTSNLVEALDDFLKFDALVQQLRRKVISAAIYPALVTGLGVGISIFLLMVVMPNFARMYQNLRAQATGMNAVVIQVSQVLSQHRAESLIALSLFALAIAMWVRSGAAAKTLSTYATNVRWIRIRVEDFQLAMLFQALALLLKGGYSMTEAMAVAGQSALGPQLQSALGRARQSVARGASVSQSFTDAGLCDEIDRRLMAAAERNGDFFVAAEVVSRMHGERFELFIERTTRLVEPVLLLSVALLVGTIVVMMYLPVFDMATRLR